jgi:hypothetical protein
MTKSKKIDCIIANENGSVYFRTSTVFFKDGCSVDCKIAQKVINPSDDYSDQPEEVQVICEAVQTPEIVAAYKATQVALDEPAV